MMPHGVTDGDKSYSITQRPVLDALGAPDLGQAMVLSLANHKVSFCSTPHVGRVLVPLSPMNLQPFYRARVTNRVSFKSMISGRLLDLL